jgi:hypothetical protein
MMLGCSSVSDPPAPPTPPEINSFAFLEGSWTATGTFTRADGSTETTTTQSVVQSSLGDRARKERRVGMREGETVEVLTLYAPSDNTGQLIVARGDGGTGTFDVLEGAFSASVGVFTSRSGTRPDGGRTRETFSEIEEDTFTWQAERSDDGGATWEVYWTLAYMRNPSGGSPPAGPDDASGCATADYRGFDFWEGSWSAGGSATNNLRSLVGGCILEENWSSAENGTSFNMYDARSGLWNQVWTDTNDNTLIIYGGLDGDQMVMSGPRRGAMERIIWTPNANGTVRQLGQSSSNGGQSWTTSYDITYAMQ